MLKRTLLIAAVALFGSSFAAQAGEGERFPQGQTRSGVRGPEGRGSESGDRNRFRRSEGRGSGLFRDKHTSSPGEAYRNFTQNELKNVPLLQSQLEALSQIQQERSNMQRERNQVADDRSLSPDAALRKFHDLLRREDTLNERQKDLLSRMVRESEAVERQIGVRRAEIERTLALNSVPDLEDGDTPTTEQLERRSLRRTLRMYDFFQSRIKDLRQNPERLDLLHRFFRGIPPGDDGSEGKMVEQARRRLEEIQQEQGDLEKRLERLNGEVRELRQLLRVRPERGTHRQDESSTGTRPVTGRRQQDQ